jgi:hypothetical protein
MLRYPLHPEGEFDHVHGCVIDRSEILHLRNRNRHRKKTAFSLEPLGLERIVKAWSALWRAWVVVRRAELRLGC